MKADRTLVEEAKKGDKQSFAELVSRHQQAVLRVSLRMTRDLELSEDVVQDSFIKAYQNLKSFRGQASFRSWLFQIVINTTKNKLRGKKREIVDIEKISLAVSAKAELGMVETDIKSVIQSEIEALPPKQRIALSMRIFEDLSFKEIAEVMNCPYDTAKANYRHALMKLRHRFEDRTELQSFLKLKSMERTVSLVHSSLTAEVKK